METIGRFQELVPKDVSYYIWGMIDEELRTNTGTQSSASSGSGQHHVFGCIHYGLQTSGKDAAISVRIGVPCFLRN